MFTQEWIDFVDANLGKNFPHWLKERIQLNETRELQRILELGQAIRENDVETVESMLSTYNLTRKNKYIFDSKEQIQPTHDALIFFIQLYVVQFAKHPKILYAILAAGFSPLDLGYVLKNYSDPTTYATFLNILPNIATSENQKDAGMRVPLLFNEKNFKLTYVLPEPKTQFKSNYHVRDITNPDKLTLDFTQIDAAKDPQVKQLAKIIKEIFAYEQQQFNAYSIEIAKIFFATIATNVIFNLLVNAIKAYGKSIPKQERPKDLYDFYAQVKHANFYVQIFSGVLLVCIILDLTQKYIAKQNLNRQNTPDNLPVAIREFDFAAAQKNLPKQIVKRFGAEYANAAIKPASLLFWQQAFKQHPKPAKPETFCGLEPGFLNTKPKIS